MNRPDAILELSVEDDDIVISKESLKHLLLMTLKKGHSIPLGVDVSRMERMAEHAVKTLEETYFKFIRGEPL